MLDHLENRPLEWGDPEYSTQQQGGMVCHGIVDPLLVHFVVFEEHQVVIITDIKPLPNSPFAAK